LRYDRDTDPFPLEAARDLLGIARALYAAEVAAEASPERVAELATIGVDLATAVQMGRNRPGSLGHRAAWDRASGAAQRLAGFVVSVPAEPMVRAAVDRLVGEGRRRRAGER
jgi:hypothetical protein